MAGSFANEESPYRQATTGFPSAATTISRRSPQPIDKFPFRQSHGPRIFVPVRICPVARTLGVSPETPRIEIGKSCSLSAASKQPSDGMRAPGLGPVAEARKDPSRLSNPARQSPESAAGYPDINADRRRPNQGRLSMESLWRFPAGNPSFPSLAIMPWRKSKHQQRVIRATALILAPTRRRKSHEALMGPLHTRTETIPRQWH